MYYVLGLLSLLFVLNGCSQKTVVQDNLIDDAKVNYFDSFDALTFENTLHVDVNLSAFEAEYFKPWHFENAPHKLSKIMWPYHSYTKGRTYGSNLLLLDTSYYDALKEESNFDTFDSKQRFALTLGFSHLRNFPTHRPVFRDPAKAGEGFPFDYNQNSAIHANEPIYVSHFSQTKQWVYVFTSYASGWLPSHSIVFISNKHKKLWEHAKQIHIIKDDVSLKNQNDAFILKGRVGMILPLISETKSDYKVLVAVSNQSFEEVIIDKNSAVKRALAFNTTNALALGNALINQNYGWGGLYEDRDCSSMLRDYFSVFGVWLPRNSFQQSLVGKVISIKNMSDAQKIDRIKKDGVAFQTLLYKRGHIMLYLGEYDGEIMIFHNTWGVKTLSEGKEGRYIIGKSIISTLNLGSELKSYDSSANLLRNLERFNIVSVTP